jgi:protein-tyrosine phosphatase
MSESGAPAIASVFALLARSVRLPAVFHCSAGKDRTGVVAALVLAALGVDDDQIAGDYHLSAPAMDRLVAWITAHRPEVAEHMARQPRALLECPQDAILVFLHRLRRRHGGVESYLADIGVDRATLDDLRATLLEDRRQDAAARSRQIDASRAATA